MPSKARGAGRSDEQDDLAEMTRALAAEERPAIPCDDGSAPDDLDKAETIARLKACAARMRRAHSLSTGQLVQWKKGLKNRRGPAYGEPAIVMQVLTTPILDPTASDSGSPYFREPLTVVLGQVSESGDFLCFHYDGRRMELYRGA